VALTQTASALPFFVFALPAGAIGDIVDRRTLILFTETWLVGVALILAVLTHCRVNYTVVATHSDLCTRTGEIAIFANFTKSTSSFPPFFFCLFNLLRMVRLLLLELLRETLRTVSKPTTQLCCRISKRS
jgi:Transmembrane secretion effector